MNRKIRMGMVGGGYDAFIGAVHRKAALMDGEIELVCGAFSSDPQKSKESGAKLYLPPDRVYDSYNEMIQKEKLLPEGIRMDFVSIVTPNHVHFGPAKMALENGFSVVCDKPLAFSLVEAKELVKVVQNSGLLFALTHNYTGYPLVKQAREMIKNGELGNIRKIIVEYPQGWLSTKIEDSGQKQASWRVDPDRSGKAGSMGDIGTHAENLAAYITGLEITELCADLSTFVPGRKLDDDGNILLRFNNGAKGILHASQISTGEENDLNIRVYGEKGGISWHQMEPNSLVVRWIDKPMQILRAGNNSHLYPQALHASRIPAGHPEGYIEAFANIYQNFANALRAKLSNKEINPNYLDFPTVQDGLRGMRFIETVVKSGYSDNPKWVKMVE
jgi:predicted dehydrogenase